LTFQIRQNYPAPVGSLPEPDFCRIWKKCRIPAGTGAEIQYSPKKSRSENEAERSDKATTTTNLHFLNRYFNLTFLPVIRAISVGNCLTEELVIANLRRVQRNREGQKVSVGFNFLIPL